MQYIYMYSNMACIRGDIACSYSFKPLSRADIIAIRYPYTDSSSRRQASIFGTYARLSAITALKADTRCVRIFL